MSHSPQFEAQIIAEDQHTILVDRVLVMDANPNGGTLKILSNESFPKFDRVYLAFPLPNPTTLLPISASNIVGFSRTVMFQVDSRSE